MRSQTHISRNTSKTSTRNNIYTLREGVVENIEDGVVEEDLVGEEVQLHAITVDR